MTQFRDLSDKELTKALWEATEQRYGWLMKEIKKEISERNRDEY